MQGFKKLLKEKNSTTFLFNQVLKQNNHHDVVYKKFLNTLMKCGEKNVSEKILSSCYFLIKTKNSRNSSFILTAIRNVKPLVELKHVQKGFRKNLMKTVPIKSDRAYKLAIDWIIQGARKRSGGTMAFRLYLELLNAYQKKGYAMKKKEDMHKECKSTFFSS